MWFVAQVVLLPADYKAGILTLQQITCMNTLNSSRCLLVRAHTLSLLLEPFPFKGYSLSFCHVPNNRMGDSFILVAQDNELT